MRSLIELWRRAVRLAGRRQSRAQIVPVATPATDANMISSASLFQQLAAALRGEDVPDQSAGAARDLWRLIAAGVELSRLFEGENGSLITFRNAAAEALRLGNSMEAAGSQGYHPDRNSGPLPPSPDTYPGPTLGPCFDADGEFLSDDN